MHAWPMVYLSHISFNSINNRHAIVSQTYTIHSYLIDMLTAINEMLGKVIIQKSI